MLELPIAVAMLLVLVFVPGLGLIRLLQPTQRWPGSLAAAPVVSAGVLYVLAGVFDLVGLPVGAPMCLSVVLLAALPLMRTTRDPDSQGGLPLLLPMAAVLGSALLFAIFAFGIGSWYDVPPYYDSFNHGLAVARIADLHTLDPATVFPSDLVTGAHDVAYYPFALHLQAAVVATASALDPAQAWTIATLIPVCLVLPWSLGLLTARLFPGRPLVPAAAALLVGAAPFSLVQTTRYGEYSLLMGLALIPSALNLLLEEGNGVRPWLLRSVALAGLAGIHTAEVPVVLVFALVCTWRGSRRRALAHAVVRAALPSVGAALLLAPYLGQMLGGYDERVRTDFGSGVAWPQALTSAAFLLNPTPPFTPLPFTICFWTGAGTLLFLRWQRRLLLPWLLFAFLFVWLAAAPSAFSIRLTSLWYSAPDRLAHLAAACALPIAALGLGVVWGWSASAFRRRDLGAAGATATGGVLTLALLAWGPVASARAVGHAYDRASIIGAEERTVFAYLAAHQRPGEQILNQWQDGSPWMYPLAGARPVLPIRTEGNTENSLDRLYLARHAHLAGKDARVDALLTRLHVRYLYVGQRTYEGEVPDLDLDAVSASVGWRLVIKHGSARVFERAT